ncbi:MAG: hypothetical protein JWP98_765 [Edaphobacter sp.]|nr:hypothetical protein [Edaphobacter sp.]
MHSKDPHVALFRRLALSQPGAVESSHMGQPDFRLNDRIFATLSAQATGRGVLKLTLEQQEAFITEMPKVFEAIPGGWGRMGMTFVNLSQVDESTLEGALATAYHNVESKQLDKKAKRSKPSRSRLQ